MRAATIREKEIVIEEHPDPEAGAGEVLVRVHAAGLNGADMMQRRGLYPAPAGAPPRIPGGAGRGAGVGLAPEGNLMPVPAGLDWPAAGGLPEVFATAHDAIFTQGELRAGE